MEGLRERAIGALLGGAVGDALGGTVEFMSRGEIKARYGIHRKMIGGGWLCLKPGEVTDDTQMTIRLGRALLEAGTMDAGTVAFHFTDWLRSNPIDIGDTCAKSIRRFMMTGEPQVPYSRWHAGNGAAMRMAPVALATLGRPHLLEEWARTQAHVTHNNELSDAACVTVGRMIQAGVLHGTAASMNSITAELTGKHPDFTFRPYPAKSSAYVVETLVTVLHCFFSTDNFKDCLIATVNLGGDADTTGAIVGNIAGGFYGVDSIPKEWLKKISPKVRDELISQADVLMRI